ncbi:Shedu anti-phage system protein SduA domain-containing protein [Streptomyces sp. NPDC050400]|uniref:Shedu anti-phage system protein SduA domain-containing protein n=1 Tax=Streptomyces sp. NPDC050400 TaxID=3365610 RepID=UPI00379E732B
MTTPRSDWSLELQLEQAREAATADAVKSAISAVIAHMLGGSGRGRRGGRTLVVLLEQAREVAARSQEWDVVRLVQDSVDYAQGRILKPDFDERYRLFQDGQLRDGHQREFLANMLWTSHVYMADVGREFLAEHPEATAKDLIEHVQARGEDVQFLEAPEHRPGRYVIPRGRGEQALWLERAMLGGRVEVKDARAAARRLVMSRESLAALAADMDGKLLLQAAELQRRSAGLEALRRVTEDRSASEHVLQRALEGEHWIFGGRFVGTAAQRRLVPGDEVDLPLIRGDGALHIVELKRSMSLMTPLVKRHRDAWVPTSVVHDAIAQVHNYLIGLDEHRDRIQEEFGIDARRASGVVLIGHPAARPEIPEAVVNETLRSLNSTMGRIEVMTYKELISHARRSLDFGTAT